MVSLALALSVGRAGDGAEASPLPLPPPAGGTTVVTTANNQIEVVSGADPVEITVVEPAVYAGTYLVSQAELAAGPVHLVPPTLSPAVGVGQEMQYTPGLWVFDAARGAVVVSGQWLRDDAEIDGATAGSYIVQASDLGTALRVREVAAQVGLPMQAQVSAPVLIVSGGN